MTNTISLLNIYNLESRKIVEGLLELPKEKQIEIVLTLPTLSEKEVNAVLEYLGKDVRLGNDVGQNKGFGTGRGIWFVSSDGRLNKNFPIPKRNAEALAYLIANFD
jgi:hypothetical protein